MDELLSNVLVGVPESVANLQLPDPNLRDYYRDEQDRIYWLDSQISDNSLDLVEFIMKCNKEDSGKSVEERRRILVMIDSPGGSVECEQSIIGAMRISQTPVWTCVYCTAYSAAADILTCGHKRLALPGTAVMFHAGSGKYEGTQAQIESAKNFFDKMNKSINEYVYSRTNFDTKMKNKLKKDDVYMNEEDALTNGVIDGIIKSFDELF